MIQQVYLPWLSLSRLLAAQKTCSISCRISIARDLADRAVSATGSIMCRDLSVLMAAAVILPLTEEDSSWTDSLRQMEKNRRHFAEGGFSREA
jgi:hypothetical protein